MILFTLLLIVVGIIVLGIILAALGLLGIFGDLIVCVLLVTGLVSIVRFIKKVIEDGKE